MGGEPSTLKSDAHPPLSARVLAAAAIRLTEIPEVECWGCAIDSARRLRAEIEAALADEPGRARREAKPFVAKAGSRVATIGRI